MKRFLIPLLLLSIASCRGWDTLRVYEKNVEIPGYSWNDRFALSFDVNVPDTSAFYNLYIFIRHTDAYRYSNLWLLITSTYPSQPSKTSRVELQLSDQDGRWMGVTMDDVVSQRVPILQQASFSRTGRYHFSLVQDMRQNPLPHVMSIGLRLEKTGRHQP
ncbi:MAG TPA: gliding motility lipoprotein GldH [Chitinophagaceae bacterium]|nr:gliding motility lipoprotein GldH [Chitinophagaceae bacterium]